MRCRYLDDFVFIHINKTAGSSVRRALRIPRGHKTAVEKIGEIGRRRWDRRLTFTVVRNPWDKVVSQYHYRVETDQTALGSNPIAFNDWVQGSYGDHDPLYYDNAKMFMPQVDWISDQSGEILVGTIMRFETIHDDFAEVMRRLGKTATLPHAKASARGHYRDYYDDASIQIIRSRFRQDIDCFEYDF